MRSAMYEHTQYECVEVNSLTVSLIKRGAVEIKTKFPFKIYFLFKHILK